MHMDKEFKLFLKDVKEASDVSDEMKDFVSKNKDLISETDYDRLIKKLKKEVCI